MPDQKSEFTKEQKPSNEKQNVTLTIIALGIIFVIIAYFGPH